jgi:hypothetical protein
VGVSSSALQTLKTQMETAITSDVGRDNMAMINFTAVQKLAHTFDVAIDDLVEVLVDQKRSL